jgi:hypothetical protein
MLNHAGSLLQTGDDGARKVLAMERGTAGLSQHEGERGFRKKGLQTGVLGADPQNFAHVTAQGACRAVDELAHSVHTGFR